MKKAGILICLAGLCLLVCCGRAAPSDSPAVSEQSTTVSTLSPSVPDEKDLSSTSPSTDPAESTARPAEEVTPQRPADTPEPNVPDEPPVSSSDLPDASETSDVSGIKKGNDDSILSSFPF